MNTKKIQIFFYAALLILPTVECAHFAKKSSSFTNSDSGLSNSTKIDQNSKNPTGFEAEIVEPPKEDRHCGNFCFDDIISDEEFCTSENLAQYKMNQAFALSQISQEFWQGGEIDRAIELLDQAYLLILGINTHNSESLIQQKEDMRFMIAKRIIEIYASREIVITGSQDEIPVIINKQVQYEIDLYAKGHLRSYFIDSYKRSGKYRQMIVEMFKKENLPQELSWLPLIESGFKATALSKSRALGLWQFMASTGYKFGLSRDQYIDERMNPEKSTQAAIRYLKELHNQFGDWSTVLAAYNCGANRVMRAIRNKNINYLDNFWDLYANLPQETARYVPKFLATVHIVKNSKKYGLDKISINSPLKFERLTVTKKIHLKDVAKITGIDRKILEELNPELRKNIVPGKNYTLNIPEGNKKRLIANIDQILRLNPDSANFFKHQVQSGETLSLIARRYRTSVENIMLANNLQRPDYIVTGTTLKIPQKGNTSDKSKMGKLTFDKSLDGKTNINQLPIY
jgi:membrane-bound lytic murein transglycosylase D